MNDPIDKVFDTTYSAYIQSRQLAESTLNYVHLKSLDLESNVTGLINSLIGINNAPIEPQALDNSNLWLKDNKRYLFYLLTGSSLLSTYLYFTRSNHSTKRRRKKLRRANKLYNGARYETILIVGNLLNPSIQRLINDLNQRGFITYVTVSSESELKIIEMEESTDIRPLLISFESVKTVKEALNNFQTILSTPVLPFPNADEHYLNLKSVLIIPDYNHFPKGLVEEIPTSEWERVLNGQFQKITSLCYNGLLKIIRENNLRKKKIERINRVYSEDDSDYNAEIEEQQQDNNIGGDTKLIFINFINDINKSIRNLHFPEQISIMLKEQLFNALYEDNRYLSQFDIPQHPTWFKRWFYPRLKSPYFINMSQLVINYSPSSSSTSSVSRILSESVYLVTSSASLQPNFNFPSRFGAIWYRFWNKIYSSIWPGGNRNHKINSTRLHHTIFDMIYSTKMLPKYQYIGSRGPLYDSLRQLGV